MTGRCCVVVADGARARVFLAVNQRDGNRRLVEQSNLAHAAVPARVPDAARGRRQRNGNRHPGSVRQPPEGEGEHRLEPERRFAQEIVARTVETVRDWKEGSVMLVAPPRMLGLLHQLMRAALAPQLTYRELARDYTHLTAAELVQEIGLHAVGPSLHRI